MSGHQLPGDSARAKAHAALDAGCAMIIDGMHLHRPDGYAGPLISDDGKGTVECHFVIRPADKCFVMNSRFHTDEVFELKVPA